MHIIQDEDVTISHFRSMDNSIIIQLECLKKESLFSNYKYLCKLKFYNDVQTPLLEIITHEFDIIRLVDNLYNGFYYNYPSIYTYFIPSNTNCIPHVIGLIREDNGKTYIQIYDYLNEQFITRISFEVNEKSIASLLELLQYTFLIQLTDEENVETNS